MVRGTNTQTGGRATKATPTSGAKTAGAPKATDATPVPRARVTRLAAVREQPEVAPVVGSNGAHDAPASSVGVDFGQNDEWWPPVGSPGAPPRPVPKNDVAPPPPAYPTAGQPAAEWNPPTKRGLPGAAVAAIVLVGVVLLGLAVTLVAVSLRGTDDQSATSTSTESPAPESGAEADAAAAAAPANEETSDSALGPEAGLDPGTGPASAAFASLPGFSLVALPPAIASQMQAQFEAGLAEGLGDDPDLAGAATELVTAVDGRMVVQNGATVAAAVAVSLDPRAADLPGLTSAGLGGVGDEIPSAEAVTIGGQDAVVADAGGQSVIVAFKNGMLLMVTGNSADRPTLEEIMGGLLANL